MCHICSACIRSVVFAKGTRIGMQERRVSTEPWTAAELWAKEQICAFELHLPGAVRCFKMVQPS